MIMEIIMNIDFADMDKNSKLDLIEKIFDSEIRDALRDDGGDVQIVDLDGDELQISYQGACSSCSAAVGGTLYFIQDILRQKIDSRLRVIPVG